MKLDLIKSSFEWISFGAQCTNILRRLHGFLFEKGWPSLIYIEYFLWSILNAAAHSKVRNFQICTHLQCFIWACGFRHIFSKFFNFEELRKLFYPELQVVHPTDYSITLQFLIQPDLFSTTHQYKRRLCRLCALDVMNLQSVEGLFMGKAHAFDMQKVHSSC